MHNFNFFAEKPSSSYRKSDSGLVILTMVMWGLGIITLYFFGRIWTERLAGSLPLRNPSVYQFSFWIWINVFSCNY